jgi:hypothetical protein
MLRALEAEHPQHLIWRRDLYLDGVPYDVRDPLVYAWMIQNYAPIVVTGSTIADILIRRPPGTPVAAAYWRVRLGTEVDLGYIPSLSTAAHSSTCAGGSGCVPYLLVTGRAPRRGTRMRLTVTGGGASYTVDLTGRPGVSTYPIRLDRLWFWPLLGAQPRFASDTPGVMVRRVGLDSGDNLY